MKRILSIFLLICMISSAFCLVSCGSELSKHNNYYYTISDYERYQLEFKDGEVTVSHQVYKPSTSSISGMTLDYSESSENSYSYSESGDSVTVNGTTYTFTISKSSSDWSSIRFDTPFLGIATKWSCFN